MLEYFQISKSIKCFLYVQIYKANKLLVLFIYYLCIYYHYFDQYFSILSVSHMLNNILNVKYVK